MGQSTDGGEFNALTEPYYIVDDFLPAALAESLRNDIDRHFAAPEQHHAETHQVWNYWYVPELYTYLRTTPQKVAAHQDVDAFMAALTEWSLRTLGLGGVSRPYLSLYVSGCAQGLHNDAGNGRFAYVYSLTRDTRQTLGGKTILLKEATAFRERLRKPSAGSDFYTAIEPRFNRLVVFDDRIVHGVERVDGSMDPREGRLVFHGHIDKSGPFVSGGLTLAELANGIREAVGGFLDENAATIQLYHGPLVLRFKVAPSGAVACCRKLLDRVICVHDASGDRLPLQAILIGHVQRQRFPKQNKATTITLPVIFGGRLRQSDARPDFGNDATATGLLS